MGVFCLRDARVRLRNGCFASVFVCKASAWPSVAPLAPLNADISVAAVPATDPLGGPLGQLAVAITSKISSTMPGPLLGVLGQWDSSSSWPPRM